jgi:hypothetical protein
VTRDLDGVQRYDAIYFGREGLMCWRILLPSSSCPSTWHHIKEDCNVQERRMIVK